ncbi:MAG TPA: glycoside hydrolase family 3 N-terminal domain-containing protein [Micromonosporaceae bacterium]
MTSAQRPRSLPAQQSSLRGLALRTLLPAFSGTHPPAWALHLVEEGLGGIALFGANIVAPEQVADLTAALRAARDDVIVATDEEGGDVTRLCYAQGSPYPGNAALGFVDDVALTADVYEAIGAQLAAVGVTLDMAPAVDVNSSDDNPTIGTRSFGSDPERVAAHAAAAVTGLQRTGISACAKHFPGHGATEADSHTDLPTVDAPMEVLWRRELPPFRAAIVAGVRSIMTAHIRVPALTGQEPATFSSAALHDLLRGLLGFHGAIISDALEMRGASGAIGVPEAAVRALVAGNDLLCIGGEVVKLPDEQAHALVEATVAAIVEAVRSGRLGEEDLARAAARNAPLGTLPGPRSTRDALDPSLVELGVVAARRSLRIEGVLPADPALVVQLEPPATIAVGEVPWGLFPHLAGVVRQPATVDASPRAVVNAILSRAGGRPVVVVSRDTHRHPSARQIVELLCAGHRSVVLVEMGWPAAWRPRGAAAYVASYGAAAANGRAVAELLGGAGLVLARA